ncbi:MULTISPECIES: LysR family transcriptional regulator [unclassified Achromobacter]|uniref:LysR family transcriptional regulator n=1 Tax=unclassified Achromobacter TaxID=2626865 RepID=UPI000B5167D3|nr:MULTISPECIES: LysR family transcriptional regulator [unclassified Achromobacter]OWT67980.1 LysR family transcriptional regulator [Achromobacter sp. HZ28]OWT81021.1 LysR family transcriptional regulator [Achromobacter sp. HZ34]
MASAHSQVEQRPGAHDDPAGRLSLHHLHVFNTVAATGGVRSTAEALFRASSAVTRAVCRFEESLGVRLFERKGTGMLLTAAGDAVRVRAAHIAAELAAVHDEAQALRRARGAAGAGLGGGLGTVGAVASLFHTRRLMHAALLADVHHMSTVAHLSGVTQPAISASISGLEETLGQPLFQRTPRGMLPTAVGERWVVHFKRVLAELRNIQADVAALQGVLEGIVTVGALPLIRTMVLPAAIAGVLARHPKLRIRTLESPYGDLCAGLLSADVDFIVGALRPLQDSALTTEVLLHEDIVLIARAGHPLARKRSVTLADLRAYPWVLSRASTPLRDQLNAFFVSKGGAALVPSVETADLALLRGLLLHSDMLTALSVHQLYYEFEAGGLAALKFSLDGMQRHIGVTLRTGAQLQPGAQALLDEVKRLAVAMDARKPGRGGAPTRVANS